MAEVTRREPGQFCWPELATTDQAAAKGFYTSVFGWTTEDRPIGPGATYTIVKLGGLEVGAIYPQEKEEAARGVPPHWNVYVSVESADEAAARARQLGATVVAEGDGTATKARKLGAQARIPPRDIPNVGRFAVLVDPQGAHFAIIRLDVPA